MSSSGDLTASSDSRCRYDLFGSFSNMPWESEQADKAADDWDMAQSHTLRYSETCRTVFHPDWSPQRQLVSKFLTSGKGEGILLILLMVNLVFVIFETDYKASDQGDVPLWLKGCLRSLLLIFVLEILARLYVERWHYFRKNSNVIDFLIVGGDLICGIIQFAFEGADIPAVSVLRVFRVLRLTRVIRFVRHLRELSFMMQGMVGATKAMFWASIFLFGIVTVWSIVAVEILNPLNVELADSGAPGYPHDCERCRRAFKSVMNSNLTFAQQIIAGDSWGQVSIPIMEAYPWTSFIFMGCMLSVNLGVMNLVLAVIVDKAVECHNDDLKHKVKLKEREFQYSAKSLLKLCKAMDLDKDGCLDFEEVLKGYDTVPEFAMTLKSMDAGREDLETVFAVLDDDASGSISAKEFVEQLYRMKTQDAHTILMFLKYYIKEIRSDVKEELQLFKAHFKEELDGTKSALEYMIRNRSSSSSKANSWQAIPTQQLPEAEVCKEAEVDPATAQSYLRPLAVQPVALPSIPSDVLKVSMATEADSRQVDSNNLAVIMHNETSRHMRAKRSIAPVSDECNPSGEICGRAPLACWRVQEVVKAGGEQDTVATVATTETPSAEPCGA